MARPESGIPAPGAPTAGAVLRFPMRPGRHAPASTVLTPDKGGGEWGAVPGGEQRAADLVHRVLRHPRRQGLRHARAHGAFHGPRRAPRPGCQHKGRPVQRQGLEPTVKRASASCNVKPPWVCNVPPASTTRQRPWPAARPYPGWGPPTAGAPSPGARRPRRRRPCRRAVDGPAGFARPEPGRRCTPFMPRKAAGPRHGTARHRALHPAPRADPALAQPGGATPLRASRFARKGALPRQCARWISRLTGTEHPAPMFPLPPKGESRGCEKAPSGGVIEARRPFREP